MVCAHHRSGHVFIYDHRRVPLVRWAMAALLERARELPVGPWAPLQPALVERVTEHYCAASYGDVLFGSVLAQVADKGPQEAAVRCVRWCLRHTHHLLQACVQRVCVEHRIPTNFLLRFVVRE